MIFLTVKLPSPLPVYLDEIVGANSLAARPPSLDGKVVGLLPNWRPAAVNILQPLGALLEQRYRLKGIVMEPPARESPSRTANVLDAMREQLDTFARRVDVAITASGD